MENNNGMEIINSLGIRIAELEIQVALLKAENQVLKQEQIDEVNVEEDDAS